MRLSRVLTVMFVGAVVGVLNAQRPKPTFEVASVRRTAQPLSQYPDHQLQPGGRYLAQHTTAAELIAFAYSLRNIQVIDGPAWVRRDRFDVAAKAEPDANEARVRLMVQSLLAERFRLVVRAEHRDMPIYVLSLDKTDRLIKLSSEEECKAAIAKQVRTPRPRGAFIMMVCGPVERAASSISDVLRTVVVNRTGLTGTWLFPAYFADPTSGQLTSLAAGDVRQSTIDSDLPSFFTAMREQLGLRLDRQIGPVDVLVIESVQEPTEN
jgi:uncharacterized protein (TIGR03435 family)